MNKFSKYGLTFDDVLLLPAHSKVLPKDAILKSPLTANISLNTPFLSAAMDTVTESKLAIVMAKEGGIGIIHKNMSISEQAKEVTTVKRYESNIIRDPITINITATIADVISLQKEHGISALPVVDDNDKLFGLITSRDVRFETNFNNLITKSMTKKKNLITVKENTSDEEVKRLLHKHKIERVLVVNNKFELTGMITVRDILQSSNFPNATKDKQERLMVGASVGVGADTDDRIKTLVRAGVDIITIDTAHGHSQQVIDRVKKTKQQYPDLQIIAGNIATREAALALKEVGADAIKVGIGPGSICTTRIITGVGMPQISAIVEVSNALKNSNIKVIADGGIRYSGDISKAFAAGAHTVMLGSLLAGTEETPGEIELYQGRSYKSYRGMGSIGAMNKLHGSSDRYFQSDNNSDKLVPEGIEGRVPFKGPVRAIIQQMVGGVHSAMGYTGCANLADMRNKVQFVQITSAGILESHVHDVSITKEAPNYHK